MAICEWMLDIIGGASQVKGKRVCEIGPGSCRATQIMLAYLAAEGVDMVEPKPISRPVNDEDVLSLLIARGLLSPSDVEAQRSVGSIASGVKSMVTWPCYAERLDVVERWDLVLSYAALEHVEDLHGFMRACWRGLKSGGSMHHMVDLSGHGVLEDPVPPLDFQTYPGWLWRLMYPVGQRVTRRHAREYVAAARDVGFDAVVLRPDRTAPPEYVDWMWRHFNGHFRRAGRPDADIIGATLSGHKT